MNVRIGREVQNDDLLLSYAVELWSSEAYQVWRAQMRRYVEESLSKSLPPVVGDRHGEA